VTTDPTAPAATALPGTRQSVAASGTVVTAALAVGNVLAYVLTLTGARVLDRDDFGALAALLALATIGCVPGIGLQTLAAVRTARAPEDPEAGRDLARAGWVVAGATAAVLLAAAPLVTAVLRLPSPVAPVLLALATVPVNVAGVFVGRLQGAERFRAMAAAHAGVQAGRLGGALLGLALAGTTTAVFAASAAGSTLAALVAARLARPARGGVARQRPRWTDRDLLREAVRASNALLALLVVTNADLLLARAVLPGPEAGTYAVGAVLTKAAFWLPQVVTVLVLPHLAREARRSLPLALAAVAGTGAVLTAGTAALGGLAVRVVGGSGEGGQDEGLAEVAWLFVAAGGTWCVVHLLLNARIARGHRRTAAPLWAAVAFEAAIVLALDGATPAGATVTGIALTALAVAGTTLAVTAAVTVRPARATTLGPGSTTSPGAPGGRSVSAPPPSATGPARTPG